MASGLRPRIDKAGHTTAIAKEPSHQKALAKGPSTYGRGCAAGASAGQWSDGDVGRSGAVLEAPAIVSSLDDVAMVGKAIEQRRGHLGIAEHARLFAEGEVGGDEDRGSLVEPADEVEEKLAAGLGGIAQPNEILVNPNDRQIAVEAPGDRSLPGTLPGVPARVRSAAAVDGNARSGTRSHRTG